MMWYQKFSDAFFASEFFSLSAQSKGRVSSFSICLGSIFFSFFEKLPIFRVFRYFLLSASQFVLNLFLLYPGKEENAGNVCNVEETGAKKPCVTSLHRILLLLLLSLPHNSPYTNSSSIVGFFYKAVMRIFFWGERV